MLQLVDQISNSFEKNLFTLGVFIDLSKTFDTVHHDILICKLKNYGGRENNLKWFESYLNNRDCPTRINIRTVIIFNLR